MELTEQQKQLVLNILSFADGEDMEEIIDRSTFKDYLTRVRAYAIDMETATIFTVGFYNKIPTGALLLVSDQPMVPEGVKTEASDVKVTSAFVENHLKIGIDSLKQLINKGQTVRHLRF
jgi:AMP nucleosidase